jgi:hypothetical protein
MTLRRGLRVAELAAKVGVGADTIRYYEKVGLLLRPRNKDCGAAADQSCRPLPIESKQREQRSSPAARSRSGWSLRFAAVRVLMTRRPRAVWY